jgi:predicted metal-dependent enzyme (double-stranded beta helix superfamily)
MFDVDELVNECRAALAEPDPRLATKEVLGRVMSEPGAVADALEHERGGLKFLHHAPDLTIINVVWAPHMTLYPHDHRMWAAIGIYAGREDNAFYRRQPEGLVASGGKELDVRDVLLLGDDVIHSVTNPWQQCTGAIHVYGGDFVNQPRSEWDPATLEEHPFDLDHARQQFTDANAAAGLD